MKDFWKYVCESLIVAALLLTNVFMGYFTRDAVGGSVLERLYNAVTPENVVISVIAGFAASFVLWHVVRK